MSKKQSSDRKAEAYAVSQYYDLLHSEIETIEENYSPQDIKDLCARFSQLIKRCDSEVAREISNWTQFLTIHHRYKVSGEIEELPYKAKVVYLANEDAHITYTLFQLKPLELQKIFAAHMVRHLNISDLLEVKKQSE